MAIRIITGVPGSGKTYFVVHHIWKNYLHDKSLLLVHNIDELKIPVSAKIEDAINKVGAEKFFTVEMQEKFLKKLGEQYPERTKFVYVIDECQRWLSRRLKISNDVYFFFQYHRHLGLDLWLITQDIANLPQEIRDLAEVEICAVPRSLIPFFNLYSQKIKGVHIKSVFRRKLQAVYDLYSHASANEVEQPKSWLLPKMIAFIVIPIVLFWYGINSFKSSDASVEKTTGNPVVVASVPGSG